MKTQLCRNGVFHRQASIEPIDALPGQFCLQFDSLLSSAKSPLALYRNFTAILGRADVLALRDLLNVVLQE